jgi:FkbM family methyltransferase
VPAVIIHTQMLIAVITLSAILLLLSARSMTSAAAQTRAYYAVRRYWLEHWPLRRGRGLPSMLRPVLKPLVPVWFQVDPNVKMLLNAEDLVSRVILETGVWDEATWLAIKQHLGIGGTFVDIGAHGGYCSLKAAPVVGPGGHVIAIEPNPEMVRMLRGNIQASGARVAVEPVACSDAEATLDLFPASQTNTGVSSLSKANASLYGPAGQPFQVTARPLDAIVREAGVSRVDVVKIDVEGAEFLVLKGAQETLTRYRPVLLVELDDRLLNPMGTSSAEIIAFLRSQRYTLGGSYDEANFEFLPGEV